MGLFQAELLSEGLVLLAEVLVFHPGGAEGFVGVHVVMGHIHHTAGDVGAVIADAFQCVQQVGPDEAGLNGAAALLQPQDVVQTQFFLQGALLPTEKI